MFSKVLKNRNYSFVVVDVLFLQWFLFVLNWLHYSLNKHCFFFRSKRLMILFWQINFHFNGHELSVKITVANNNERNTFVSIHFNVDSDNGQTINHFFQFHWLDECTSENSCLFRVIGTQKYSFFFFDLFFHFSSTFSFDKWMQM